VLQYAGGVPIISDFSTNFFSGSTAATRLQHPVASFTNNKMHVTPESMVCNKMQITAIHVNASIGALEKSASTAGGAVFFASPLNEKELELVIIGFDDCATGARIDFSMLNGSNEISAESSNSVPLAEGNTGWFCCPARIGFDSKLFCS